MQKKTQRDALRAVAEIRQLVMLSADMLAERAQATSRSAQDAVIRTKNDLEVLELERLDAISRSSILLEIMPAWDEAVTQQSKVYTGAQQISDQADAQRDKAISFSFEAKWHAENATAQAKVAAGRYVRSLEEALLQEQADHYLQHRSKA